jgi:glycine oxidase
MLRRPFEPDPGHAGEGTENMLQTQSRNDSSASVSVIGAGIAGTWQALLFAEAGCKVAVYERGDPAMTQSTSHWAGGMLAPYCEGETAEPLVTRLGVRSLDLWRDALPADTAFNGSLVLTHARDRADLERFTRLSTGHERLGGEAIAALEPDLAGRFSDGLFFAQEGHIDPRHVLSALHARLHAAGVPIEFNAAPKPRELDGTVIDCRGMAAHDVFPDLRGVKGEIVTVETDEITLKRPVRLLHPRWTVYVVPRNGNRFFFGATSIETDDGRVSVRSALELLTAAYALHPAFAEARIVDIGAALRPAFPDNLPRVTIDKDHISVNGLYRHGFLMAPALAELTVAHVLHGRTDKEVVQCM